MGVYDGPAEGQANAAVAPAVGDRIPSAVKHIEYPGLFLIWDPGPIVGNGKDDRSVLFFGPDRDMGAGGRIFDGVIDDVDDHLDDQPGIHPGQEKFLPAFCNDGMLCAFFIHMTQCLGHHVVHQILGDI